MDLLAQARLLDTVRRLVRRSAHTHLDRVIDKTQPADLAQMFPRLSERESKFLLKVLSLDLERAAEVISFLDLEHAAELLPRMEIDDLVGVFAELSPDDAADLLPLFPEELSQQILDRMKGDEAAEVEELL
ncbi:MAG: magnesium transporter, partial [Myxococcota bacterium]|nr:magnesium transporter [Myxococcota bacterium]